MEITIESPHFTPREKLNAFVKNNVGKISRFYDRIESVNVCLKLDKSDKTENKVCEIRVGIPGNDLFAKRQCETFEEATMETIQALFQQIDKIKTKFENRKTTSS